MFSLWVHSHRSCLVRLNRTQVHFPFGADLLGRCEYNNRTRVRYRDPVIEVWSRSASKQTLVQVNGWTNEWNVFLFSFWFTCKKGSVKANHIIKKNRHCIWSGPKRAFLVWIYPNQKWDQWKWAALMWCINLFILAHFLWLCICTNTQPTVFQ